jgi:NADPH-dependent glutamate synthase beta subunit-like oxidoreductase/ferredoxin/coenzyme F420-reducing hydrogenase delta subunit
VNVKAYVSLIAERRFAEALEVIRRRCPLPGICGRVCNHPCEEACSRGEVDEPIAIRSLKRFVADLEREYPKPAPPPGPPRAQKVAVVGSGPAGLTAAYDLRLAGFPVTVFERESEAGGMLRWGITAYRLPRDVLDAEIEVLQHAGVELRLGAGLGAKGGLEDLFAEGYAAVLLAVGAQIGGRLDLPGEKECKQIEDALAFLRRVNDGDRTPPGDRVVVIGGGSTAVEAARAALRLGARSVQILYRRYREELLAGDEEIEIAQREGIRFQFLVAPIRIVMGPERMRALVCTKIGLGEPDRTGRRRPIPIPGTEFLLEADRVLVAVGQETDFEFLDERQRSRITVRGRLRARPRTAMTDWEGVFAAGDAVTGPATVIEAVAAGHRAAESIRHYIEEGRPGIREERPERSAAVEYGLPDAAPVRAMRIHPRTVLPEPGREFAEVEQAFDPEEAVAEARRCLRCGPCGDCHVCAPSCARRHIMVRLRDGEPGPGGPTAIVRTPGSIAMALPEDTATSGWLLPTALPESLPEIETSSRTRLRILPVRSRVHPERCRGCGRCVEACPFGAAELRAGEDGRTRAWIEPSLCRGCNLCTAECPTEAAVPTALSPEWWGSRLEDIFHPAAAGDPPLPPYVVLACQRRAGALEASWIESKTRVEVVRLRCVGQVDAAMLLDLYRQGARGVLVAGCATDRCRFDHGARFALEQVRRARALLELQGCRWDLVAADASANRASDPLDEAIRRLTASEPADGNGKRG